MLQPCTTKKCNTLFARVNEEYLMTNWYLDLTSTKQELQKRMGIRKALRFEKGTQKHPNLTSEPNLFLFSVLEFEAVLPNFIRKVSFLKKMCYFKAYSHKML